MFCGSCMQDNTLVRTLRLAGEDAVLVPTYTPITVDEENVSTTRVFMGGINVYLDSVVPGWRWLPGWVTHWLDRPGVIRALAKLGSTEASKLGSLTLDMLKGNHGPQRREVAEFTSFLCDQLQPDIIIFSNALLSGVLSELRPKFSGKILCLLQGDDIFLEALTDRWKQPVLQQLRQNCDDFDGFLTHSQFYRRYMSDYLKVDDDRFRQIPLSIDVADFQAHGDGVGDHGSGAHGVGDNGGVSGVQRIDNGNRVADVAAGVASQQSAAGSLPQQQQLADVAAERAFNSADAGGSAPFRVGYFARICPEKGIHNLLAAAEKSLADLPHTEVVIAGYLASHNRRWFERLLRQASERLDGRVRWLGSPAARSEKIAILRQFDLLCVPTDYREPKGLYVLEAGLAGVPSLLPDHGAFPEIIQALGHGHLYQPNHATSLHDALATACSAGTGTENDLPNRVTTVYGMEATGHQIAAAIRSFDASAALSTVANPRMV